MPRTLEVCRTSFDEIAKLYDEARPCYPHQLVKDVLRLSELPKRNAKILEIGSGTGRATEHFISKDHDFYCIEPGPKSIEIARSKLLEFKNISFENVRFEDWNNKGKDFDLVFSGQAFHWVDSHIGFKKAAEVLKVNGCLALFWNTTSPQKTELDLALDEIYNRYVPFFSRHLVESLPDEAIIMQQEKLKESGKFERIKSKRYSWIVDYTAEAYINLMKSFTDVHLLSDGIKKALFKGIRREIKNYGGVYTKSYRAVLLAARKVTDYVN